MYFLPTKKVWICVKHLSSPIRDVSSSASHLQRRLKWGWRPASCYARSWLFPGEYYIFHEVLFNPSKRFYWATASSARKRARLPRQRRRWDTTMSGAPVQQQFDGCAILRGPFSAWWYGKRLCGNFSIVTRARAWDDTYYCTHRVPPRDYREVSRVYPPRWILAREVAS